MTTTATEVPTHLPPIECAPWCLDGSGHSDAWHPADQWCVSEGHHVYLTAEPMEKADDGWEQSDVAVYASRDAHAARALITLTHNGLTGVKLTGSEARELANALLVLAGTIERS